MNPFEKPFQSSDQSGKLIKWQKKKKKKKKEKKAHEVKKKTKIRKTIRDEWEKIDTNEK